MTGNPLYSNAEGGPITSQVPKLASLHRQGCAPGRKLAGQIRQPGGQFSLVGKLGKCFAGHKAAMDDLASIELTRLAQQDRHNGEDEEAAAPETAPATAPTASRPAHSLAGRVEANLSGKLAQLTRSALGESGLIAKKITSPQYGDAAWPTPRAPTGHGKHRPAPRGRSKIAGVELSETAQGFLQHCRAHNLSLAAIGLLATVHRSFPSERALREKGGRARE